MRAAVDSPPVMPTRAADFVRDGYCVLPRFLGRGVVARLKRRAEQVMALPAPAGCERPNNRLAPLGFSDPAVQAALGDPARIGRLSRAIDAQDLRWISAYLSSKEPGSGPLWRHQDWWCWHPRELLGLPRHSPAR